LSDPCALWLSTHTVSSPTTLISQDRLYWTYAQASANAGRPVITKQMFGRNLKRLNPGLQQAQRMVDGKKQWVYLGISLREPGLDTSPAGRHTLTDTDLAGLGA
jgi:hypothetical protein